MSPLDERTFARFSSCPLYILYPVYPAPAAAMMPSIGPDNPSADAPEATLDAALSPADPMSRAEPANAVPVPLTSSPALARIGVAPICWPIVLRSARAAFIAAPASLTP